MIITVASGKGGTGKTTFAVNLAYALDGRGDSVRLLDCDVEEPNDHLFVKPEFTTEESVTVLKPVWDESKCNGCGKCAEICNYNAIAVVKGKVLLFNELCHSCGACSFICPEKAITEKETVIGLVQAGTARPLPGLTKKPFFFAHGFLNIAEPLAPNVVRVVKKHIKPDAINIIDACPGTACPVVEAVNGADIAVMVTEPTPFGLNDLKLAVGLSLKMGVPTGIVVNRSDGKDAIIADYAESIGVPIMGRIPFKREYAEAYSSGQILVELFPELRYNLVNMFELLCAATPPVPPADILEISENHEKPFPVGTANGYKEVTVISGKGGTGKTSLVASLAVLAENKVLVDNDVDAADLHLLLSPSVHEIHKFAGGKKAIIDSEKCTGCGKCSDLCHFDAIDMSGEKNNAGVESYKINEFACEGCGLCGYVCPFDAINISDNITGKWYVSGTDHGPMVHARLGIAEENSGRLVAQVRNRAAQLAHELKMEQILGDGPPGTGCPVIASVSGADLVLIVTEPTVSGVHDMERVLKLSAHFGIPTRVVINKADLNADQAKKIYNIAEKSGSRVIGKIPFDRNVNDALMAGKTIVEYGKSSAEKAVRQIWIELKKELTLDTK